MITLNLLGAPPATPSATQRLLWAGPLVLALGMCIVHGLQSRRLTRLADAVEDLKSHSGQLSRQIEDASRRARLHSELAARLGLIDKLGQKRGRALELLTRFGSAVSEQMWLVELSYSSAGVTISGVADTAEEVAAFLGRLDAFGTFTAVDLVELERDVAAASRDTSQCRFIVKGRFAGVARDADNLTHGAAMTHSET